jgi:Glycosyl transferases group 1
VTPPDILVYSHEWHLTRSGAFLDLVVQPLQEYANVVHQAWPSVLPSTQSIAPVLIFCQLLPPIDWMAKHTAKLIWIPMWDDIWNRTQSWWNQLPKSLHIVAFSQAVATRAHTAGLPCLRLEYFKNPGEFCPANWAGERVLLYWNRRGLISREFLKKFCAALSIDRLLFRGETDPAVDARASYDLPKQLGHTIVETLPTTASREAYWQLTQRANVVIAPRLLEGAGMVFLEALARGCAVFANDAPTMNEYILHRQDGYLFRRPWSAQRMSVAVQARLANKGLLPSAPFIHGLPESQNWDEIAALDLQMLGQCALTKHRQGYENWLNAIPGFARFVLP